MGDVADQLAAAAATTGLRPHPRTGTAIRPPAVVVGVPEEITFDQTYGRGLDVARVTLFALVGLASARSGADALLGYMSGTGSTSVKAAIEAGTYTAFDDVHVVSCAGGTVTAEGVEYLAATFEITVHGRGN